MKALFSVIVGLLISSVAVGDILVEQISIPIGNPNQGNTGISSTVADVIIQESQAWDNFVISEPVNVEALHWSGAFNNEFNPDENFRGDHDFRIQFVPNLPAGKPDVTPAAQIAGFELDGGTSGRNDGVDVTEAIIPNQLQKDGGAIVRYEADLEPFVLQPGTYWLSIQAVQKLLSEPAVHEDPEWSWVISSAGDGNLYSYDELFDPVGAQPGVPVPADAAFTLFGERLVSLLPGDFDENGSLEAADIDMLSAAVRSGSTEARFDVDGDGLVNNADHAFWVETLKGTFLGDASLDGHVAFDDFLQLSDNFALPGGWAKGNFDTIELIDFTDFLLLADNFNKGTAAAATSAVPEPAGAFVILFGGLLLVVSRRRRLV